MRAVCALVIILRIVKPDRLRYIPHSINPKSSRSQNRWLSKSNLTYFYIEARENQTLEHHNITTPGGDGDDDVPQVQNHRPTRGLSWTFTHPEKTARSKNDADRTGV